ncbi:MAG: malonyl-ACP O-methyltransferase BioC [Enterobacteriaceae bacterium]
MQKIKNTSVNYKLKIAKSFDKEVINYNKYAHFQKKCGMELCKIIGKISKKKVLDAGCGTGIFSRYWKNKKNFVVALDISLSMIKYAKNKNSANLYILGDIENISFKNMKFDIIFSNLAVQWCKNLSKVISNFFEFINPGGIIAISTLIEGSLIELKEAWSKIDNYNHINSLLSYDEVKNIFKLYNNFIFINKIKTIYYKNIFDLFFSIKKIGANYLYGNSYKGLTTKRKINKLELNWKKNNSKFPISYNIIYGILFK